MWRGFFVVLVFLDKCWIDFFSGCLAGSDDCKLRKPLYLTSWTKLLLRCWEWRRKNCLLFAFFACMWLILGGIGSFQHTWLHRNRSALFSLGLKSFNVHWSLVMFDHVKSFKVEKRPSFRLYQCRRSHHNDGD